MVSGSDEPLMAGIQGDRRPCRHFARSQIEVEGSAMRPSNHSLLACRMVAHRTLLRCHRVGPCARLTSAATMLQALFHQAALLGPGGFFLAKNLSQVTSVSVTRSRLAREREGMSVIKGLGKMEKSCFHSCSI